jgi:hypothetical protein
MPEGQGAGAPLELTIGACAKILRQHRDVVDTAMKSGELPYHRDSEGRRVAALDDLLAWMRRYGR